MNQTWEYFLSSFSVKVIYTDIPNVDVYFICGNGQLKPSIHTHIFVILQPLLFFSLDFPIFSCCFSFQFLYSSSFPYLLFSPSLYLCPSLFHPVFSFSLYLSSHLCPCNAQKKAEFQLFTPNLIPFIVAFSLMLVYFWFTSFDLKLIGVIGMLNSTGFESGSAARLVLKSLCRRNSSVLTTMLWESMEKAHCER